MQGDRMVFHQRCRWQLVNWTTDKKALMSPGREANSEETFWPVTGDSSILLELQNTYIQDEILQSYPESSLKCLNVLFCKGYKCDFVLIKRRLCFCRRFTISFTCHIICFLERGWTSHLAITAWMEKILIIREECRTDNPILAIQTSGTFDDFVIAEDASMYCYVPQKQRISLGEYT